MPFRCAIVSSTLQTVLKGVEGMAGTVVLTVREDVGLMGIVQDDSLIALCDWVIKASAFEDFKFYATTKTQIVIRVRIQSLFKFLAGGEKHELVELYMNDNPTFLGMNYTDGSADLHGSGNAVDYTGKLPLEKMTEEDKTRASARIPCDYHADQVTMKASTFSKYVNALSNLAPNIKVYASPQDFEFSVEDKVQDVSAKVSVPLYDPASLREDKDAGWVKLGQMTSTFQQRFPVSYLKLFSACSSYVDEVEIFFAKDSMLILRYMLPSRHGYVSYFISPLLQDDGTRDQDVMQLD